MLIDLNRARAEGEAMDLNHAVPFTYPTRVWAGDYADCAGAAVTVVTAGANQRPGETRLELVARNAAIFRSIIPQVAGANPEGIILVATNPVDVLTLHRPARLRAAPGAGHRLGDDPGHGPLPVPHQPPLRGGRPQRARLHHRRARGQRGARLVAGQHRRDAPGGVLRGHRGHPGRGRAEGIYEQTRDAAYHIIERKGATYYAIGAGLLRIVEAILRDQRTVLTVSSLIDGYYGLSDVAFSLPTVIDRGGVEQVIRLRLSDEEQEGLRRSAGVLRGHIEALAAPDG